MKVETKQITAIQSDSTVRKSAFRLPVALASLMAVCGVSVALVAGCGRSGNAVQAKHAGYTSTQWSRELFDFAVENLNHLEDNDCQELLRR